jgi:hypothetical protein
MVSTRSASSIQQCARRFTSSPHPSEQEASEVVAVSQDYSRCSLPETDIHLFFHYFFARAVWFSSPLGFKADHFDQSCYPAQVIQLLLSAPSSVAPLKLIFANLWMLWKA